MQGTLAWSKIIFSKQGHNPLFVSTIRVGVPIACYIDNGRQRVIPRELPRELGEGTYRIPVQK